MLFSTEDANSNQTVAVSNAQGEQSKVLFKYSGRISFTWAPIGDRIAYIVTDDSIQVPNYGRVHVVDVTGQNSQEISPDPALAFFWSPSGKRLAYLTVQVSSGSSSYRSVGLAQQGNQQVQLQWKVKDLVSGTTRLVATFTPTENFVNLLPFYDQYARSMTFWSPDSQSLVYTTGDSSSTASVWIAAVASDAPPRKVGEGLLATWSWK